MEKRILVVDDEPSIRDITMRIFTRAGYEVQTAGSAEEALTLVQTQQYPVFFLDLNLPGMNGVELCRRMLKKNPCSIGYAVTGYTGTREEVSGQNSSFEDCFTKPTDMKTLLRAADRAFQKLARLEMDGGCA